MGVEAVLQQLSGYVAVTPGTEGSFVKSLKAVAQDIETHVEKKISRPGGNTGKARLAFPEP